MDIPQSRTLPDLLGVAAGCASTDWNLFGELEAHADFVL